MIRRLMSVLGLGLMAVGQVLAAAEAVEPRFATVAICIDSGTESLAAWQVEFSSIGGEVGIVGVEGGAEPFESPPYYDATSFRSGRLVLAALTTDQQLRRGVQRVATVHVMENGRGIQHSPKLEVAGNEAGLPIVAQVWSSRDDCKSRRTP